MISLPRFQVCACLAICALPATAATPLTNIVPENAALILAIHDAPALVSKWEKSPWARTWNDEQVKKFFGPMREQMKIDSWNTEVKAKTGFTVDELVGFATGEAVIYIQDFNFAQNPEAAETPPILVGVEIGDNQDKIEALMAKSVQEDGATEETEEFSGVVVHTLQPKEKEGGKKNTPTIWAIVEGKWLVSPQKQTVLSAIDAVKNGGAEQAWGRSERYARLQQRADAPHVTMLANIEAIYPVFQAAVLARQPSPAEGQQQGPFGFDAKALLDALGLDALREFYGTVRIRDDVTDLNFGLTYNEVKGLLKMLAYKEGPLNYPSFVSPKWIAASTDKFSLKEAYAALEEILEAFNPAISGMVQGQIRGLNKQLGIDLKRDLIGSLGDDIVTATTVSPTAAGSAAPRADELEQLVVISLSDAAAFTNALEAIKRSMGPQAESIFKAREYLGEQIFEIATPGAPQPEGAKKQAVNYCVAKGHLFVSVGSAAPVESALQGLAEKRPSLWEKPEVKAAIARVPASASAFQFQDLRAVMGTVFKAMADAGAMMNRGAPPAAEPTEEGAEGETAAPQEEQDVAAKDKPPFDATAIPDAETLAKYWSHGWGYAVRESTGIYATSQIIHPK